MTKEFYELYRHETWERANITNYVSLVAAKRAAVKLANSLHTPISVQKVYYDNAGNEWSENGLLYVTPDGVVSGGFAG